tara:strand:- start:6 stop:1082 length:1077 start_codon:yes stop_codon:yes gene_type:complete
MAYTTIDDPSKYFQTATWTGSSGTDTITFDGNSDLQLDWLWSKCTSNAHSHALMDTSRITSGDYLPLFADTTDVEQTFYDSELQSILSDGFTVGTQPHAGGDGKTYVGFAWKANGGSTTSVSASGTVLAGTYQANTTAGFSIMTYTGEDDTVNTVTHGLGAVPAWIIVKGRSGSGRHWRIYHHKNTSAPETDYLRLNETGATTDDVNYWYDTAPTSSVFSISTANDVNANTETYVAYAFAEVQGYSKFGSYTGNGNADGPFVYTGFKPAWLLVKRTDSTGDWSMYSNKLGGGNPINGRLEPNNDDTIVTGDNNFDFLSNGFKGRDTPAQMNASGGTYIYMTFAEHPFVSSKGVPTTAR